jgi:transketolase
MNKNKTPLTPPSGAGGLYEELLLKTALEDERFIVMTAENRALVRNMPKNLGNRFIDTGITEQTMIGAAAGLALRGRIPVTHALASFLSMRAFEFVRTDAGIPNLPVKLSSFIPGFLSDGNGPTHQAVEDISLMRGIPNMTVFAPADEQDLLTMLPKIWNSPNPAYVRINTRKTDYQHVSHFEIGKAEVISKGTDITILVYGMLFEQALIAAELLKNHGKSVGLVNMRSLKPVDEQVILEVCATSELVITLEDHFLTGGLYSIVAETLLKNRKTANVMPFALKEKWFKPSLLDKVLEYEGFTGKQIAEKILGYQTNEIQPEILLTEFAE